MLPPPRGERREGVRPHRARGGGGSGPLRDRRDVGSGLRSFAAWPARPLFREALRRFVANAGEVPSPATERLCEAARRTGIAVVVGVAEWDAVTGGTVYRTLLFIGREGTLLGKHRKLKPTTCERVVWREGGGSSLRVYERPYGKPRRTEGLAAPQGPARVRPHRPGAGGAGPRRRLAGVDGDAPGDALRRHRDAGGRLRGHGRRRAQVRRRSRRSPRRSSARRTATPASPTRPDGRSPVHSAGKRGSSPGGRAWARCWRGG